MKNYCLFLFLIFSLQLSGQVNLVPNPGFDIITSCPDDEAQINKAVPWYSATLRGTPDLYNECAKWPSLFNVPKPLYCNYIPTKTGGGYAGIVILLEGGGGEYIATTLTEVPPPGVQCFIRFFVAPDEDCSLGETYFFTDAVGLALSETRVLMDIPATQPQILPLKPVVENRGKVIKDTANWTKISGCYISKGGEKYAIIGNFRTEAETKVEYERLGVPHPGNYAFIDDVLISPFNPLPDTILLCKGKPESLNAAFWESTYLWNTGGTDSVITVNTPGLYSVQASIDNCVFYDTVTVLDTRDLVAFQPDTTICRGEPLALVPPMPGSYQWSNGSQGQALTVQNTGLYSVTVTNDCGEFTYSSRVEVEDCACNIYVPNAFSPNGDGANDELQVFPGCDFEYRIRQFRVFDRWGANVYLAAEGGEIKWDGTFKGKSLPTGAYVWFLEYHVIRNGKAERRVDNGEVLIVR